MKTNFKLLLSPEADPLAAPAGTVKPPSYPVMQEGMQRMVIRTPSVVEYNGVKYLSFRLESTKEALDTTGKTLHPGFKFSHLEAIQTNEWEPDMDNVVAKLSRIVRAIYGAATAKTARDIINNPESIDGLPVDVKVGIRKANEAKGKPEQNTVKLWVEPK